MSFKPLLGKDADLDNIQFPVLASVKLDGIRGVNLNGNPKSRNLLDFPNLHTTRMFENRELDGLDGEFILGDPFGQGVYSRTNSAIMSIKGEPNLTWYVFDDFTDPDLPFDQRLASAQRRVAQLRELGFHNIQFVQHHLLENMNDLLAFEAKALLDGYEGIMIRNPNNKYKYGRSTVKEGTLLKVKRFMDAEAEITAAYELMSNQNPTELDELGHTKRSSSQEGLKPMGVLGGFTCVLTKDLDIGLQTANGTSILPAGTTFNVGSGFTADQRKEYWDRRDIIVGQELCKFKFFSVGVKDKPRFPIFKGLRNRVDA
jgi:DNA ligase-1